MAELVNLRIVRKRKARSERERTAAENRARFGTTKAERLAERKSAERAEVLLDGHRREPPTGAAGKDD